MRTFVPIFTKTEKQQKETLKRCFVTRNKFRYTHAVLPIRVLFLNRLL